MAPLLLAVYALMLINQGVTLTDTGYNYSNFIHFDSLDNMWKFSTYLATAVGAFFTRLPGGYTMIGLNLYTGLIKTAIAIIAYYFARRVLQLPDGLAFLAEVMALGYCWCPTALVYNYLTYLLFTLGGIFLVLAVEKKQYRYYVLAGICLGMNVLVRFPNLAEMALILAVWIICILQNEKFLECLKRTGFCLLGYVSGLLLPLSVISAKYGISSYIQGITDLLSMPSQAEDYSWTSMIWGIVDALKKGVKWPLGALALCILGSLLFAFRKEKGMWVKWVLFLCLNIALMVLYAKQGLFKPLYYKYDAIFNLGVFFIILAGLMGLWVIFFRKENPVLQMYALVMGVILLITPLGSNNGLITSLCNLFLAVPFVFACARELFFKARECRAEGKKQFAILEALWIAVTFWLCVMFVQGTLFGATFVFRDGVNGEKRNAKITEIDALAGMYTTTEKAEQLEAFQHFLEEENLEGSDVILLGTAAKEPGIPGFAFFYNLNPVISSVWPDLNSFSEEKFAKELEELKILSAPEHKPLIVIQADLCPEVPKHAALMDFMDGLDYTEAIRTDMYICYR